MGILTPVTLTQIAKVIWEGDAYITWVLGMGMPKTRGCPYHCNSSSGVWGWGGGGNVYRVVPRGGARQSFTRGGSVLRSQPEPFDRRFLSEKVPLSSLVFKIWKYKKERSPLWAQCRAKRAVYPTRYPARSQSLQSFWSAPKIRTMITPDSSPVFFALRARPCNTSATPGRGCEKRLGTSQ